jgi:hypothetical protein
MIQKRLFPMIFLFLGALLSAASWAAKSPQGKSNLAELKKGIELFESVLNQSLAQTLGGPFETLDRARGAYLPGYGVVFTFEVNLTPLQNLGPFGPPPTPKSEQAQREEEIRRRERAKSVAQQTLGNFGQTLTPLTPDESVTIVIYTVAAHPGKIERGTIILSAEKKLLDARVNGSLDQTRFIQKLSTTEY